MPDRMDDTFTGGADAQFPQTQWTRILNPAKRQTLVAELGARYWKPVYAYLRRKGFSNDRAKDLVQGFFADKILGQEMIQKANRAKGKFRTFLLTAVTNYAIDLHRANRPTQPLCEDLEQDPHGNDPAVEFNRTWAEQLLQEVLEELKNECHRNGKESHWQVFETWFLEPDPTEGKHMMSEICARCGVATPEKAYNMISNIKGRFRSILRRRLRPLVDSDAQVDLEISDFIELFSRSPAR